MLDGVTAIIRLEKNEYAVATKRFEAAKAALETDSSEAAQLLAEERHAVMMDVYERLVKMELALPPRDMVPLAFLIKPIAKLRVRKESLEALLAVEEASIAGLTKEHSWKWSGSKGIKRESAAILVHRGIIADAQELLAPINKELTERETYLRERVENQLYIDALALAAKGEGPIPQRYLDEQEAKRLLFLKENPPWIPTGPYISEKLIRLCEEKNKSTCKFCLLKTGGTCSCVKCMDTYGMIYCPFCSCDYSQRENPCEKCHVAYIASFA